MQTPCNKGLIAVISWFLLPTSFSKSLYVHPGIKLLMLDFPVVQWLRIHLPMQGTQVRALVREDPTCCGAAKPVRHNY